MRSCTSSRRLFVTTVCDIALIKDYNKKKRMDVSYCYNEKDYLLNELTDHLCS